MSAPDDMTLDEMALSDEALEAWLAVKINRRPLVRTMSALDGFVTAAVTGPAFPDPQYWMCPLLGLGTVRNFVCGRA